MKRQEFLKSIALFTGGLTVVSCNPSLIDDLLAPGETPEDLSIGVIHWRGRKVVQRGIST